MADQGGVFLVQPFQRFVDVLLTGCLQAFGNCCWDRIAVIKHIGLFDEVVHTRLVLHERVVKNGMDLTVLNDDFGSYSGHLCDMFESVKHQFSKNIFLKHYGVLLILVFWKWRTIGCLSMIFDFEVLKLYVNISSVVN